MKSHPLWKGVSLCLITGIAWGGQFPVAGSILQHINPFYFALIRYGVASVLFLLLLLFAEGPGSFRLEGKGIKLWILGSMGFAAYNFLVFPGQKMAGASGAVLTSVMMGFSPLISVMVIMVYKKIKPPLFTVCCICTGFIGVFMVVTKGDISGLLSAGGNGMSFVLILLGVICSVIYTIGGGMFSGWSSLRYTALTCLLGTGTILVVVVLGTWIGVLAVPRVDQLQANIWSLAYMIVIAGVLAFLCWNEGNKILSPINASLFINLVPIVSVMISVIQGYAIRSIEIIGASITISALFLNNLYQRNGTRMVALMNGVRGKKG
ncbi:DMT family transporter [Aneurinibacillus uraniidurans]|uniref:DMT family transporter n=1 Tax=Aneurinibacillus uraniidurans TaxID=2966586 RepID=UPI002349CEDA|nr:DMT family transporter [Aneurinibacillus sp. B1]WCN39165.1 DMT family transporter [Aneurinibacillus sp. B1]